MAGQQLAALSTLDLVNTREFAASFADDDLYIIDYLLGEVINHLLPPVQEFLFKTAIVNRFCTSLGDTLMEVGEKGTGSDKVVDQQFSRAIIEQLDQSNLHYSSGKQTRTVSLSSPVYWSLAYAIARVARGSDR